MSKFLDKLTNQLWLSSSIFKEILSVYIHNTRQDHLFYSDSTKTMNPWKLWILALPFVINWLNSLILIPFTIMSENILDNTGFYNSFTARFFSRHYSFLSNIFTWLIFWVLVYYYRRSVFAIALKENPFSNAGCCSVIWSSYTDIILIIFFRDIITNFTITYNVAKLSKVAILLLELICDLNKICF